MLASELGVAVSGADAIARDLIALSALDFVALANRIGHDLVGDGSQGKDDSSYDLAQTLETIVEAGLAAKLGLAMLSRLVISSRAGAGAGIVEIPFRDIILAEGCNAGLDGRPHDVRAIPPEDGSGKDELWAEVRRNFAVWPTVCVPLDPAIGFGTQPMDRVRTILKHLELALGISEMKRMNDATEKLAARVNARLETLASPSLQREPKRWYLLYPQEQDPGPAQKLKELLPQLRVCCLSEPEDFTQEEKLITVVSQFLERKRKRANRQ
jgi:hypothetical protein